MYARIDEALKQRLEAACASERRTEREVVAAALRLYLATAQPEVA